MNTKNAVIVGIAALVIVLGGLYFLAPSTPTVVHDVPKVGALTGPDIPYPYLGVGGVRRYPTIGPIYVASTTISTIQSPPATSTLQLGAGCRLAVSSSTASQIIFAKASQITATTTFLWGQNITAGAAAAVVASTSNDNFVFGPSQYLNISMSGGTGTFSPTGNCQATFEVI